jgi:hypothetical protein
MSDPDGINVGGGHHDLTCEHHLIRPGPRVVVEASR